MGIANGGIKIGTLVGNGAAQTIILGFVPDYVKVINTEDGDRIDEWYNGQGAGTSITTGEAVAANADNGITAYDDVLGQGFTIGTDISEADKTLFYHAIRSM